jgi:hypothetical protein
MRSPDAAFDIREALSVELRAALDHIAANDPEPKTVHRCRVRVKRARALARIGAACAPGLASVFIDSARTLMRALAQARDPAALTEAAHAAGRKGGKTIGAVFETVVHSLDEANAGEPSLNVEAVRAGLKDLLALAQVWPEASPRQVRRGARKLDRRARRARQRGVASHDPYQRHKWRSREKERFFAASILGQAWPGRRRRKTGEKLGVLLGNERDALLLMERLLVSPELAGDDKSLRRALKTLNRQRGKFARRADLLAAKLRAA